MPKLTKNKSTPSRPATPGDSAVKRRALAAERRSHANAVRNLEAELRMMQDQLNIREEELRKEQAEKEKLGQLVKRKDDEIAQLKAKQTVDSFPECPVCLEEFSEQVVPRIIGCGHSVCSECLCTLVQQSGEVIFCPFCRASSTRDPRHPYPVNFALKSIVSSNSSS